MIRVIIVHNNTTKMLLHITGELCGYLMQIILLFTIAVTIFMDFFFSN